MMTRFASAQSAVAMVIQHSQNEAFVKMIKYGVVMVAAFCALKHLELHNLAPEG